MADSYRPRTASFVAGVARAPPCNMRHVYTVRILERKRSLALLPMSIKLAFLSIKLAFHSIKLTFHSLKLAFHSLKLAFHSLKLTFHSLKLTFLSFDTRIYTYMLTSAQSAPPRLNPSYGIEILQSETLFFWQSKLYTHTLPVRLFLIHLAVLCCIV